MILTPSSESQTLTFIPNKDIVGTGVVKLTPSGTNRSVEYTAVFADSKEFTTATVTIDIREGTEYDIEVLFDDVVVYKDIAFATAQVAKEYQTVTVDDIRVHVTDNNYFNLPKDE